MSLMPPPRLAPDLLAATFAANPAYELVLFDRLAAAERETLAGLRADPDLYGILRPRDPRASLTIKAVDRDTALLFLTLTQPGELPAYLAAMLGEGAREAVARLVYDSVLGIAGGGELRLGVAAHALLCEEPAALGQETDGPGRGLVPRLSDAALRHAEALLRLGLDDPAALSSRLYAFHRIPASARWRRLLPSPQAVAAMLGCDAPGRLGAALGQRWRRLETATGWVSWSALDAPAGGATGTFKLYVSPRVEHLAEAFRVVVETLTGAATPSFKVGRDLCGVLRPDKLVIYCSGREAVTETAERLLGRLDGMPAHGVPFTAAVDEEGLLSWGVDPPRRERLVPWRGGSWRRWLTDRLAAALIAAAAANAEMSPRRFALERVRLEGIDPVSWAPAAELFH